ncbi:hypothetical protein HDV00_004532 [Rhizophlyctis rosea]|nr:hypothetical protein HDV00_004532 [Rhizophlyctis rosea]
MVRWAAKEIMTPTGTLVIIRAIKRPEGFRGNYGRAADLMATVEVRAKQEAEQLINAAARALSRVGKDRVEIVVKYRVGDHRERIRQILEEVHPTKLIIGSNKRRIGNRFHHGSPNAMIPADLNVELITVPEGGISTPGSVGTAGTP